MLHDVLNALENHYGTPGLSPAGGPLDMILWENITAIVNEENARRKSRRPGLTSASRSRNLRKISQLVMELFDGDITRLLNLPIDQAKKALQLFPGINEPGAEKILLLTRRLPVLALDSNGLRSLLRLGFGTQRSTFAASYFSVQEAIGPQTTSDFDWLIRAHHLLRIHGQEICRPVKPRCFDCPVRQMCVYARERSRN